jgi:ASC-1-like (ASCH) protein
MKTVTMKHEYLEMIRDQRKSLEIRVGYPAILAIKKGDVILTHLCLALRDC